MTFDHDTLTLLDEALRSLERGFGRLPDAQPRLDREAVRGAILAAAERMRDNYPYQHPLYVGQMLKPPHPVARLAYALATYVNPNNHALDGGRASSAMEKEAVAQLAHMIGWETHLGHLVSGGTVANLEALWVAGRLAAPGATIVASTQAHYTHQRISGVLGLKFEAIPCDWRGRIDRLCRFHDQHRLDGFTRPRRDWHGEHRAAGQVKDQFAVIRPGESVELSPIESHALKDQRAISQLNPSRSIGPKAA